MAAGPAGTDGALALGLIHWLIHERAYDDTFVRGWTNAPLLVRDDTGMLLAAGDVVGEASAARRYVAAVEGDGNVVLYDAEAGAYSDNARLALRGARRIRLADGSEITCRPVF